MSPDCVACTIVSLNYIPYARVLCRSFLEHHPGGSFHVLIADRKGTGVDLSGESFLATFVEDLGIPDFASVSFQYGILELNTAVKPSFLKHLFRETGACKLIYLDPDILVYSPLQEILRILDGTSIVVTPHITQPVDADPNAEREFLSRGAYNLGFIGLSRSADASGFLDWWETRCLSLGFVDPRDGLFVDQKWVEIAPCLFDSVHVLRHPGCNMAYWNLRERRLAEVGGRWMVNGSTPLVFFHFSGIDPFAPGQISRFAPGLTLAHRPDLETVYSDYRRRLGESGIGSSRDHRYTFGCFSNGEEITHLARMVYSLNRESFRDSDPFDAEGGYYKWARKHRLLASGTRGKRTGKPLPAFEEYRTQISVINRLLKASLFLLGPERYALLMGYLSHISIIRNQGDVYRGK